jgi:hypothetical protein
VETIHVINKPGQEPQTRVASSVNEAMQLAGEINEEVCFNDVTSNVRLHSSSKDLKVERATEEA